MQKRTPFSFRLNGVVILATTYFHTGYTRTIIGDDAFHFRVRYGNGWGHVSKATRVLTLVPHLQEKIRSSGELSCLLC